jgi:3-hydroxy-9,10-secoandrosta-1,3,5(10)-triene-9,17-dione monooxygenase reductase component
MNITEEQFRKTLGLFPTGVTVISVPQTEGQDLCITISSLTSVSLDPPQVLFCLSKNSKTMPAFKSSQYFAVNILNVHQSHLSEGFAKRGLIEWETIKTHRHSPSGCLLFSEALGHIICERGPIYEGGDHEIILGKVIDLDMGSSASPLVRQRGQYLTTQVLSGQSFSKPTQRKLGSL